YLLLPYSFLLLPFTNLGVGRWDHVLPAALLIWAVAAYRRPTVAGLLLGLAARTVYFPVMLLPVWLNFYGGRGGMRFAGFFFLASLGIALYSYGDLSGRVHEALALEPETPGFWTGLPWAWAYRLPVFIGFLALLVTTALWPSPKNLGHLLAL